MLHIYCGDGKGKTTASIGLALRGAGSQMRVHIFQLMKGNESAEFLALKYVPNITVQRCDKNYGFTRNMTLQDKTEITQCHNKLLQKAEKLLLTHQTDMLILDEFNTAYEYPLLERQLADHIIFNRPPNVEIILTGRNPHPKFIEIADYISEIKSIRHPFEKGIKARKGIEF